MTSIQMPQLGETIVEGTILKWLKHEGDAVEPRRAAVRDLDRQGRHGGPLTGRRNGHEDPRGRGRDGAGRHDRDGGRGGGRTRSRAGSRGGHGSGGGGRRPSSRSPSSWRRRAPAPAAPVSHPAQVAASRAGSRTPITDPVAARAQARAGALPRSRSDRGHRDRRADHEERRARRDRLRRHDRRSGGGHRDRARPGARPSRRHPLPRRPPIQLGVGDEAVPMTHIRRAIASTCSPRRRPPARAWTMVEVNVDHLVRLRERVKDDFERKHGVKLTYLPHGRASDRRRAPGVPDRERAARRREHRPASRYVNMGIAVSYDAGLIVPVIKGADGMNTVGIARAIADLAARARAHQLTSPTRCRAPRSRSRTPARTDPLPACRSSTSRTRASCRSTRSRSAPVVVDDAIAIRSMVNISMSWDHRVIDGELATRFLARVSQNLETWDFAEDLGL